MQKSKAGGLCSFAFSRVGTERKTAFNSKESAMLRSLEAEIQNRKRTEDPARAAYPSDAARAGSSVLFLFWISASMLRSMADSFELNAVFLSVPTREKAKEQSPPANNGKMTREDIQPSA